MERFDDVIVGAGSSGCMLAARLSADPATRVLLIEAGAENTSALTKDPTAWPAIWETPDNYAYETTANAATGHVHDVPRGRVFGGSGAINAMLYLRGARSDYDGWAASGARGWSYDEVLPYFKRMETASGDPRYRRHRRPAASRQERGAAPAVGGVRRGLAGSRPRAQRRLQHR